MIRPHRFSRCRAVFAENGQRPAPAVPLRRLHSPQSRERHGVIALARYEEVCRPAMDTVEGAATPDPLAMANSEADLTVVWVPALWPSSIRALASSGPCLPGGRAATRVRTASRAYGRQGSSRRTLLQLMEKESPPKLSRRSLI